jgi:hypothetical protein
MNYVNLICSSIFASLFWIRNRGCSTLKTVMQKVFWIKNRQGFKKVMSFPEKVFSTHKLSSHKNRGLMKEHNCHWNYHFSLSRFRGEKLTKKCTFLSSAKCSMFREWPYVGLDCSWHNNVWNISVYYLFYFLNRLVTFPTSLCRPLLVAASFDLHFHMQFGRRDFLNHQWCYFVSSFVVLTLRLEISMSCRDLQGQVERIEEVDHFVLLR